MDFTSFDTVGLWIAVTIMIVLLLMVFYVKQNNNADETIVSQDISKKNIHPVNSDNIAFDALPDIEQTWWKNKNDGYPYGTPPFPMPKDE